MLLLPIGRVLVLFSTQVNEFELKFGGDGLLLDL